MSNLYSVTAVAKSDDVVAGRNGTTRASTTNGKEPGKRGQATRRRLLEKTGELIRTTPLRSIRVIDIAKAAGTSPATFYQYFETTF